MFILFLGFLYTRHVRMRSENVVLDSFWFDTGGTFSANVSNYGGSEFILSLCTKSESKKLAHVRDLCSMSIDDLPEATQVRSASRGSVAFNGTIPRKSRLYPLLGACGQRRSEYDVALSFQNGASRLDWSVQRMLISKPVFLACNAAVAVVWLVNWVTNRRVKNCMHRYFSVCVFSNVAFLALSCLELRAAARSDRRTPLRYWRLSSQLVQRASIFSVGLMMAKGLCLIRLELPRWAAFECILVSAVVTAPTLLFELRGNTATPIRIECLSAFNALRVFFLLKSIQFFNNSIEFFFVEHKLFEVDEIAENARELSRFKQRFYAFFYCALAIEATWLLDEFRMVNSCALQIVQDTVNFALILVCGWTCRLQSVALVIEAENLENRNEIKWENMKIAKP